MGVLDPVAHHRSPSAPTATTGRSADAKGPGRADAVTFYDATQTAHDADADVTIDDDALNPTFGYRRRRRPQAHRLVPRRRHLLQPDEDRRALPAARATPCGAWAARTRRCGSISSSPYGAAKPTGLETIAPGVGRRLRRDRARSCTSTPRPTGGSRTIEVDPGHRPDLRRGLPGDADLLRHRPLWRAPGLGGADLRRWAGRPLDAEDPRHPASDKHAPATFFVIGQNMQARPGLVAPRGARGPAWSATTPGPTPTSPPRRSPRPIWRSTPPSACSRSSPAARCASSGRPISATPSRSTPGEVEPLLIAQGLGYLIVGLRIDPDDWKKPRPGADRPAHPRPARRHRADRPGRWCCCTTPAATAAAPSRPCPA